MFKGKCKFRLILLAKQKQNIFANNLTIFQNFEGNLYLDISGEEVDWLLYSGKITWRCKFIND